jgi:hypothetical protein
LVEREGLWEEVAEAVVGEVGLWGGEPDVDEHDVYGGGLFEGGELAVGFLGKAGGEYG